MYLSSFCLYLISSFPLLSNLLLCFCSPYVPLIFSFFFGFGALEQFRILASVNSWYLSRPFHCFLNFISLLMLPAILLSGPNFSFPVISSQQSEPSLDFPFLLLCFFFLLGVATFWRYYPIPSTTRPWKYKLGSRGC